MAQSQRKITPAEYLRLEREAKTKSEYFEGQTFAMAGASFRHNLIVGNFTGELRAALKQTPCAVCPNDMRVKVSETGLYTYPDVVVVCGEPVFDDDEMDTLLNPTILVEVLSPSTADYDLGRKFEHYRAIPTVRHVVIAAQDRVHLVDYRRQPGETWTLSETRDPTGVFSLPAIDVVLRVEEIYARVKLDATSGPRAVQT